MNSNNKYKIIDGTFTSTEAANILFSMIDSKIRHHRIEELSNNERFGSDVSQSHKRVDDLMKVYAQVEQAIDFAAENKLNLKIDGVIEITFVEQHKELVGQHNKHEKTKL